MRGIIAALGLLAVLLSATATQAQDSPDQIVRSIYAAYDGTGLGVAPTDPGVREVFSSRLQGMLDEETRRIAQDGLGRLDFDIFVDGQDFDVTGLTIGTPQVAGNRAKLDVDFFNFGEPRHFRFHFIREFGRWHIDEIETLGEGVAWQLSALLNGR